MTSLPTYVLRNTDIPTYSKNNDSTTIVMTLPSILDSHDKIQLQSDDLHINSITCDVCLQCDDGNIFSAHKVVLRSVSPYFSAMFHSAMVEKNQAVIKIHNVQSNVLKTLIDFAYSGEIMTTTFGVLNVLIAANMLCFGDVEVAIIDFLCRTLNVDNCVEIFTSSEIINSEKLSSVTVDFVLNNFGIVSRHVSFYDLSCHQLEYILSHNEGNIISEIEIFEAVLSWVKYDVNARAEPLPRLLGFIRFDLMTRKYFVDVVLREHLIMSQCESRDTVLNALDFHILPERTSPAQKRKPFSSRYLANRKLYVLGGQVNGRSQSSVECFNFKSNTWSPITSMKSPRSQSSAVTLDGSLFVAGGMYNNEDLSSVEKFNPSTDTWERVASLKQCKGSLSLAVIDGWIYAVGGSHGRDALKSVEQYDPMSNMWSVLPCMRLPRSHFGLCVMNGLIYATGGYCGISEVHHSECFDPVAKKWSEMASMNQTRMNHGIVSKNNRLFVFGGKNSMGLVDSVEKYNPELNMWLVIKTNFYLPLGASVCLRTYVSLSNDYGDNVIIVGGVKENDDEENTVKLLTLKLPNFIVEKGTPMLQGRAFSAVALL